MSDCSKSCCNAFLRGIVGLTQSWCNHSNQIVIRFIPVVSDGALFNLAQIGVWTRIASRLPFLVFCVVDLSRFYVPEPVGHGLESN